MSDYDDYETWRAAISGAMPTLDYDAFMQHVVNGAIWMHSSKNVPIADFSQVEKDRFARWTMRQTFLDPNNIGDPSLSSAGIIGLRDMVFDPRLDKFDFLKEGVPWSVMKDQFEMNVPAPPPLAPSSSGRKKVSNTNQTDLRDYYSESRGLRKEEDAFRRVASHNKAIQENTKFRTNSDIDPAIGRRYRINELLRMIPGVQSWSKEQHDTALSTKTTPNGRPLIIGPSGYYIEGRTEYFPVFDGSSNKDKGVHWRNEPIQGTPFRKGRNYRVYTPPRPVEVSAEDRGSTFTEDAPPSKRVGAGVPWFNPPPLPPPFPDVGSEAVPEMDTSVDLVLPPEPPNDPVPPVTVIGENRPSELQPTIQDYKRALYALNKAKKRQRYENAVLDISKGINRAGGPSAYDIETPYTTWKLASTAKGFPFNGRGAYSLGKAWRSTVGKQGGRLIRDALVNRAVGAISGQGLYTGHGAYTANNLMSDADESNSMPMFSSVGDETGAICISHREYITDIYGPTTAFNVQSYALNPGLEGSFPWLSQLAANYEEYELIQCVYTYRSTTTDIGTTTTGQCGTVIMATNYNPCNPPFSDKPSMMEYAHSMSCKTTESMDHGVECEDSKVAGDSQKYIRTTTVVSNQDLKTYDHGLFQLAVANSPAGFQNQPIGELWVYYTVMLRKPRLYVSLGKNIQVDEFMTPTTVARGLSVNNANNPWVSTTQVWANQLNNLGCQLTLGGALGSSAANGSSAILTFPAGYSGAVRITLVTNCITYTSGSNRPLAIQIPTGVAPQPAAGNVVGIYDLFDADGNPGYVCTPNFAGIAVTGDFVTEAHVYVRPATGGVNNCVLLTQLSNDTPNNTQAWQLRVEEYNSRELLDSDDRANYVRGATILGANDM